MRSTTHVYRTKFHIPQRASQSRRNTHDDRVDQRFSTFFQVGTTFISQNVLRTALLLSRLEANCLRFSTTVCDTQFTLILLFMYFWTNVQSKRTTRAEPEDHLWSADHGLKNAGVDYILLHLIILIICWKICRLLSGNTCQCDILKITQGLQGTSEIESESESPQCHISYCSCNEQSPLF
jgi:hypothetical protein